MSSAMLNGSSFGTGKASIEQYSEDFDVFRRLLWDRAQGERRGGRAARISTRLAKSKLKIVVDEAKDTEGNTGVTRQMGVFIAVDVALCFQKIFYFISFHFIFSLNGFQVYFSFIC